MKLAFSPAEQAFRQEIRGWLQANVPPDLALKVKSGRLLSKEDMQGWHRILGKKGWLANGWPKELGGPGWTVVERHLFEDECSRAGAPRIVPFGPVMLAPVLMAFGSPEQQARFLPGISSGETWWCQGYSEPGAGSDLASLKTRAERRGDVYVLNGQKAWTTLAQYADWMFLLVRTSAEARPQKGISFVLLDMKSKGITVRPVKLLDGEHEVNEVFLDDVEVPVDNRVGEEGHGWTYAKHLLGHERASIANVNRAKRELERLKRLAREQGVYQDPRFRDDIARLEVDVIALEMLVLRVLGAERSGKHALDVAGLLKIRGSEVQQRTSELMMLAGGPAALASSPEDAAGRLFPSYFNMRKTSIYGGTNEVQRNIVAQTLLG